MSDAQFTDEILMAFADGELDEETTRRVEAALESDDELMARVALFMETRAAASEALKPVLAEPVPDELVQKVRAMAATAAAANAQRAIDTPSSGAENVVAFRRPTDQATSPQRNVSRLLMALAASLLVVVGGAGGYLLRGGGLADTGAVHVAGSVDPALSAILDQAASGEEVAVGEGQGTVRLVSAFELAGGQLCREYELTQPGQPALVSVACRKASIWQTRLTVAKPGGGDGYAPASSLETVDAFLTSIGAGQPLDAEAEKRALAAK
ncbi:anti-sigma factor [Ensifer adhaerens]|uniref:anti-sigma factor family protein n=1 Tax=Ensifer adhaerens TaxID=106592 RepID=UPI001CBD4418|nr:zf-HC2 domain-containing protein [Ensifer adhaerens]MBZ7924478.1 anti-sigma factor [Ensifer adhaerens]UAX96282.1 anti-sigma factor [Ensifer adhaerens]UAY04375.1 anti-sigma factor [Ensifer adhaerens]UAY12360.1 anti-sigma factor [Ensifer adhaerens]